MVLLRRQINLTFKRKSFIIKLQKERKVRKMTNKELYSHIDYTLLKPTATFFDFVALAEKAEKYGCASICIPSSFVKVIKDEFPSLNICTVVGFPLGNSTTETKMMEAIKAIIDGANEIDMVINISNVLSNNWDVVIDEINTIKKAIGNHILKVIIETCYLEENEKYIIELVEFINTETDVDYIKTSTGFGTRGATFRDIELIREGLEESNTLVKAKIKASGGIRTREEMKKYIEMGCDRIGASVLPE